MNGELAHPQKKQNPVPSGSLQFIRLPKFQTESAGKKPMRNQTNDTPLRNENGKIQLFCFCFCFFFITKYVQGHGLTHLS